jgi:hypothetical protein
MAQRWMNWLSGVVQTTDATQTTLFSYDLSSASASGTGAAWNDCTVQVMLMVTGKSGTNHLGGELLATFKRNSGTLAIVGAAAGIGTLQADAALATASVSIDASGNIIRVRVTGVAATTIDWSGNLQMWFNQP